MRIDGTDVLTVYAVVRAAAERARRGEGPYLVEALTYRTQAHTTSDDPTRYRTDADVEPWRQKDPISARRRAAPSAQRLRRRLRARGERRGRDARRRDAPDAVERAAGPSGAVFDLVYANPPESLLREKAAFLADLQPEGGAQ